SWWQAVHRAAAPAEWDDYRREVAGGSAAADRIVAPSRAVLDDLAIHYGMDRDDTLVIPNGIDLAAYMPRPKRSVVMAAGRLWDAAKNLALLDNVAAGLPWPVEIAGPAANPEGGTAECAAAHLLGALSPAEMAVRLGRAAIFAAPARYEPFGLGILEAAASGCALALGDVPSLRENWEGAALFVAPDDCAAWRSVLRQLIEDDSDRALWAFSAQQRARGFSLDAWQEAYPDLPITIYDPARFDLDHALDGADVVLVHEWNEPALVARIAAHRRRGGRYLLLFHDTHHRMITDPEAIAAFDLDGF